MGFGQVLEEFEVKQCFSKDWVVYIYNDDTTPIELVVDVLVNIFEYNSHKAVRFAYEVNDTTGGIVGRYPEKLAMARVKKALEFIHSKGFKDFRIEAKEV